MLDKNRRAAMEVMTESLDEGLRYPKSSRSSGGLIAKYEPPPPPPRTPAKTLAEEFNKIAARFEKLGAEVVQLNSDAEAVHDKLWGSDAELDDVPSRPDYRQVEDLKNDIICAAGWNRVIAAKLLEAPKRPTDKK